MSSFLIDAFQADAVNSYLAPEPPKPQFSLFNWLQACWMDPAGDQNYGLREKEEVVIGQLQQEVATKFKANSAEHEGLLHEYFSTAMPGESRPGRRDERWKLLGFQDDDPRSDFRGGGLLSLKCLIWMTKMDAPRVAHLIRESNGEGTEGTLRPEQWYPFAVAVINVCFELSTWLMLDQRREGGKVPPEDLCSGSEYRRFAELTVEDPETFFILAAAALCAVHEEWSNQRSVFEFRKCIKARSWSVFGFQELHVSSVSIPKPFGFYVFVSVGGSRFVSRARSQSNEWRAFWPSRRRSLPAQCWSSFAQLGSCRQARPLWRIFCPGETCRILQIPHLIYIRFSGRLSEGP